MTFHSHICCTHLRANVSSLHPEQVGVGPRAAGPGGDLAQILGEPEVVQVVVDELADVPRQIVVPAAAEASESD